MKTSLKGNTHQLSTKSLPSGRFGGGSDSIYMNRCIQLARNGQQNAQPNPMVGAVVVYEGRIIGEGYHVRCGEGHAEVNALASVKKEDEHLLKDSTIYVHFEHVILLPTAFSESTALHCGHMYRSLWMPSARLSET